MLIANSSDVVIIATKSLLISIIEKNDNIKHIIPIDIFNGLFISSLI